MKFVGLNFVNEHLKNGLIEVSGLVPGNDRIIFYCKDGTEILMYHDQNCCERVFIESADSYDNNDDIYTDCDWCIIEEVSNVDKEPMSNYEESYTWTFYNIKTNKGYDTIRWYGSSNGYYSESVDFADISDGEYFYD